MNTLLGPENISLSTGACRDLVLRQGVPRLLLHIIFDTEGILENVILPLDNQGVLLLDWSGESFAVIGVGGASSSGRRVCHLRVRITKSQKKRLFLLVHFFEFFFIVPLDHIHQFCFGS